MTLVEQLMQGGMATVVGVILVVVILAVVIIARARKIKENAVEPVGIVPAAPQINEQNAASSQLITDTELVAVITAAIAAMTGTSTDRFVVCSIRRQKGVQTPWNIAAKREQHINI